MMPKQQWELSDIKASVGGGGGLNFVHESGGDANGLLYWLGTNDGARAFANPSTDPGTEYPVTIDASSTAGGAATDTTDRATTAWLSSNSNNQWVRWKLALGTGLVVKGIDVQNHSNSNYHLKNFVLEGSNDGSSWTLLASNNTTWALGAWKYFDLSGNTESYRYFRLRTTGYAGGGSFYLQYVRDVELYGQYSVG